MNNNEGTVNTTNNMNATNTNNNINSMPVSNNMNNIPEEYKPISMWGYFGYELLFLIPCVGFIVLLVFAFGGNKNINVRNFARSYFCLFIITAIIFVLLMVLGVGTAISTPSTSSWS